MAIIPPPPPPTGDGQKWTSQYVRRFAYFKIYFSAKFTLFKNDHTIQNGRWCPRRSPIGPYLLFRFLQRNEHSKLSSTENSSWKISSAAPLLKILLCSHWMENPEHLTRCDPGRTWVMDSWGWWTPGFTHDSYASHAVSTLSNTKISWSTPT